MKPVLRHIVLCAFKPEAGEGDVITIVDDFVSLQDRIFEIRALEQGINTSPENLNDGYTHCFTLSFASEADRDTYLEHPEHTAFVERFKVWLDKVLVFDYWAR